MANFKTMYYEMFNAMTDAIIRMQDAQRAAEEMYIEYEQSEIMTQDNNEESANNE